MKKKITFIGVTIFVTLGLFIWGLNYLKGENVFAKNREYFAVYEQVNGLNVGSPVIFKGIKVGQIKSIEFTDEYASQLVVVFNIERNFKIPHNSIAEIYNTNIIGGKGLRIIGSESKDFYSPGDTLISSVETGLITELESQFTPLKTKTARLMTSIDSVVVVLNELIVENKVGITSSITNIEKTVKNFNTISTELNKMINSDGGKIKLLVADIQEVTSTLQQNKVAIDRAINNFSAISDTLASANLSHMVRQTNYVIDQLSLITEQINSGKGSAGKLIYDDSLYLSLEALSTNLNILVEDIQSNPRKYLRFSIIDASKNEQK